MLAQGGLGKNREHRPVAGRAGGRLTPGGRACHRRSVPAASLPAVPVVVKVRQGQLFARQFGTVGDRAIAEGPQACDPHIAGIASRLHSS